MFCEKEGKMKKYASLILVLGAFILAFSSICLAVQRRVVIEYFLNTG